jgi:hypothetical protein
MLPPFAALAALIAAAPAPAAAQAATPAGAVAASSDATPHYRSALDGYRPFGDVAVQPWRESNDRVARIGGWKAYLREAQGAPAQPAASAPDAADPRPQRSPDADSTPRGHMHHERLRQEHPQHGTQPSRGRTP